MCEREALSIRMGGGQHIELDTTMLVGNTVVGNIVLLGNTSSSAPQSSGGNENHYVAIDHPLLKESHHYFTLHITLQLKIPHRPRHKRNDAKLTMMRHKTMLYRAKPDPLRPGVGHHSP